MRDCLDYCLECDFFKMCFCAVDDALNVKCNHFHDLQLELVKQRLDIVTSKLYQILIKDKL